MAHVMIPAREDVDPAAIHHSGVNMPSISLTGEGCEVEKVNASSFVIKVTQPSFDALSAITDLQPVWESVINTQEDLARVTAQSKDLRESVTSLQEALALYRKRVADLESHAAQRIMDIDEMTANHVQARQKQSYISLASFIAMILSFVALGLALWTLKV